MLGSLRERLARRQHLQRRIDMLLEGQACPGIQNTDAYPLDGDDIEAAIAEFFAVDGTSQSLLVFAAIVDRIRDRAHSLPTLLFGGINRLQPA